jgi:hypothetical protein
VDVYDLNIRKLATKNEDYIPYMFDKNHLTVFGADQLVDQVEKAGLF